MEYHDDNNRPITLEIDETYHAKQVFNSYEVIVATYAYGNLCLKPIGSSRSNGQIRHPFATSLFQGQCCRRRIANEMLIRTLQ